MRRRIAFTAGAIVCLVLAAGFFAFATDVGQWRSALRVDDVRFRTSPEAEDLWQPDETLPKGIAAAVLGVRDDVRFREALRMLRLSRLDLSATSDPRLALARGDARARLQEIAGSSGDRGIRSRAMGLLGVLSFASALADSRDQFVHIQDAIATYQSAIDLDPTNDEAKANLELALQRGRGLNPSESGGGANPSPGGSGAKGAGAGDPGSGY
jgi:hypothetical protein